MMEGTTGRRHTQQRWLSCICGAADGQSLGVNGSWPGLESMYPRQRGVQIQKFSEERAQDVWTMLRRSTRGLSPLVQNMESRARWPQFESELCYTHALWHWAQTWPLCALLSATVKMRFSNLHNMGVLWRLTNLQGLEQGQSVGSTTQMLANIMKAGHRAQGRGRRQMEATDHILQHADKPGCSLDGLPKVQQKQWTVLHRCTATTFSRLLWLQHGG